MGRPGTNVWYALIRHERVILGDFKELYDAREDLFTIFRADLITERACIYTDVIHKERSQLENGVSFIDFVKIAMERLSSTSVLLLSSYYGAVDVDVVVDVVV